MSVKSDIFTEDMCRKIGQAIKRSGILDHINPTELIQEKINKNKNYNPPNKKPKIIIDSAQTTNNSFNNDNNIFAKPSVPAIRKTISNNSRNDANINQDESKNGLPRPELLFQSSDTQKLNDSVIICESDVEMEDKPIEVSKSNSTKEKQKLNLSNLASAFLPKPNEAFDSNLFNAVAAKNQSQFLSLLKKPEIVNSEINSANLQSLIKKILENRMHIVLGELCNKLHNKTEFAESLCNALINSEILMSKYKNDFLPALETMIKPNNLNSLNHYIKACVTCNEWNKMIKLVFKYDENYKFSEENFQLLMSVFKDYSSNLCFFTEDTIDLIIKYIRNRYPLKYKQYIADAWLYCIYHDVEFILPTEDEKHLDSIIFKIIENLNIEKEKSFFFVRKMMSSNLMLLSNDTFCLWVSEIISDRSDVRACIESIYELVKSYNQSTQIISDFYLLAMYCMRHLNGKSLNTHSKYIFDRYLKSNSSIIKSVTNSNSDKFQLKWSMIECLISSNDFKQALAVLKDFDALKDLEKSSVDYEKAKEMLPNLVSHLICSSPLLAVIDLFEQIISIFIYNETVENSYIKNCNEIFDMIVEKVYNSQDQQTTIKMLQLLDSIVSSDIDFNLSVDMLRYMLNSVVKVDLEFEDLIDLIELCCRKNILGNISNNENDFSNITVESNLSSNEIEILVTWICRKIKIKLVDLAQNQDNSIAKSLTQICSVKFNIKMANKVMAKFFGNERHTFNEFVTKFTNCLSKPKYLTAPIGFNINRTNNTTTIEVDSRSLYNAIYYSNI